jgi:hypothetical protein
LAARNKKGIKAQSIWEPGFRDTNFRRDYALLYSMLSRDEIGIWLYIEQPGASEGPRRPNAQPFQDASPQSTRPEASPSPTDQMKRGTQQMNNVGLGSPLPEGVQTRDSPSPISSIGQNMEPILALHSNRINGNMDRYKSNVRAPANPCTTPGSARVAFLKYG